MEEPKNGAPPLHNESEEVLDIEPLRTLSPMFPATPGFNMRNASTAPPFLCVTPVGPFTSSPQSNDTPGFVPFVPSFDFSKISGLNFGGLSGFATPENACSTREACKRKLVDTVNEMNSNDINTGNENANGFMHAKSSPCLLSEPSKLTEPSKLMVKDDPLLSPGNSFDDVKVENAVPLSVLPMNQNSSGTSKKKSKKRRSKAYEELMMLPFSSHEARESVEVVLMTFDAIRRRLLQIDEANDVSSRCVTKAGTIMMEKDLRANKDKRIGPVPGVEVGDLFYCRIEMCLVGLHAHPVGGIDYMTARFFNEEDPIAICVVSAGVYENDEGDTDMLIYTGQGGGKSDKEDQKLERGNLALERSLHRGNEIRVVRSAKDANSQTGKSYIYDGLYKIQKSWVEMSKLGFNVFKYQLYRQPEQPEGIAVWRRTEKWKADPSSRGKVILPDISSGIEKVPVCLINDVDEEKGPGHFVYAKNVKHLIALDSTKPLHGCSCIGVCLPNDTNCACAKKNGGHLPYTANGLLVSHKPIIYECGGSCSCSASCRNRMTQNGLKLHFEVFRTRDRGWGLRSWGPIRAGAFVCEYIGEVVDGVKADEDGEEDNYVFRAGCPDQKALNWNHGTELLGENGCVDLSGDFKPLSLTISAKNIGNVSRFMNHSCSPNIFWQAVLHDHDDERYPHIMFFALKHIPPMTELTYDYGTSSADIGEEDNANNQLSNRRKKCLCASPKCRGFFGQTSEQQAYKA